MININKKCPICNKLITNEQYTPFCSKRCADIDLNRWFSGTYSIPVIEEDTPTDTPYEELK